MAEFRLGEGRGEACGGVVGEFRRMEGRVEARWGEYRCVEVRGEACEGLVEKFRVKGGRVEAWWMSLSGRTGVARHGG